MANGEWWQPKELLQDVVGAAIFDVFKRIGAAAGKAVEEKGAEVIGKAMTIEVCRVELQTDIRELAAEDPAAAAELFAWLDDLQYCRRGYLPGDENHVVEELSKMRQALEADPEKYREHLRWLGHLPRLERDARIANLTDDRVQQWVRRAGYETNRGLARAARATRNMPQPARPGWRRIFWG